MVSIRGPKSVEERNFIEKRLTRAVETKKSCPHKNVVTLEFIFLVGKNF